MKLKNERQILIPLNSEVNISIPTNFGDEEIIELIEGGGYSEQVNNFYSQMFRQGDELFDLNPSIGFFSLYVSQLVGGTGNVLAVYDRQENAENLKKNIDSLNIENIELLFGDGIYMLEEKNRLLGKLFFLKLKSDMDLQSLENYAQSLLDYSPVIIVRRTPEDDGLINIFLDIGFSGFIFSPGLNKLVPVDVEIILDRESQDLYLVMPEQVMLLRDRGVLIVQETFPESKIPVPTVWQDVLAGYSYSKNYIGEWDNTELLDEWSSKYISILNIALHAMYVNEDVNESFNQLLYSFNELKVFPENELTLPRLFTCVRLSMELGLVKSYHNYSKLLFDRVSNSNSLDLNQPFVAINQYFQNFEVIDFNGWCLNSVIEAHELSRSYLDFNISKDDLNLIDIYFKNSFQTERMKLRKKLLKVLGYDIAKNEIQVPVVFNDVKHEYQKITLQKPKVAILYHLARTGGTLISKCLACIQGNYLLSEIHPLISVMSPIEQAYQWFDLMTDDEKQMLLTRPEFDYLESLKMIQRKVQEKNGNLIIRDWSHIDFTAIPFVNRCSYELTQSQLLSPHMEVNHLATVRHPIDSYLSVSKLSILQDKLTLENYLKGAKEFALKAEEIGFVKYEDFCEDPVGNLKNICRRLNVNYDDDFIHDFYSYSKITGEITGGRAAGSVIKKPKRPEIDRLLKQRINECREYWEILEILGYEDYS